MKILNLVLIIQILLLSGPLASSKAYASDCQEGMYFHPRLQRCVLTQQTQDIKHEVRNVCAGKSGEDFRKCYEENAMNNMSEEGRNATTSDVNKGNLARYGLPIIVSTIAAYYLLKVKKNNPACKTGSMWLLIGGAAAGLLTEFFAQSRFRKETERIEKEYKESMNTTEDVEDNVEKGTNAQAQAISYMIDIQEERKAVANKRKKGYLMATVAYGAALGLAIYEQTQVGSMSFGACSKAEANSYFTPINKGKISTQDIAIFAPELLEEYEELKYTDEVTEAEFYEVIARNIANSFISDAHANTGSVQPTYGSTLLFDLDAFELPDGVAEEDDGKVNPVDTGNFRLAQQLSPSGGKKEEGMIDQALKTPYIRATLAGLLGGYSYILHRQAKKNEDEAQKRINALNEILIDFTETGGAGLASYCTEKDRKLPSKPGCYCYNKDGTQNKMRKGRDVCIFYAAHKAYKKGEYEKLGGIGYSPMKACLTSDGKVNGGCTVCSRSPKTCELIPAAMISGFSIGSVKPYGSTLKNLNDFNDGSLNSSNFDEAGLEKQLKAFQRANKKLSSDPKNKDFMGKVNKLKSQIEGTYKKALNNASPKTIASINGIASGGTTSSSLQASIDKKLSDEVKEKIKQSEASFTAGGEDATANTSSSGDSEFDFGFGDSATGEGGVEITDDVAEVMDKNFQFNSNDIHKNKGGNIFKILSIRYQRSALIRLFDDKGEYQIDEANKSDINKQ